MLFRQHILSIKTLTFIFNLTVLCFLNFDLITSFKVLGNSDRVPESIKDTMNTLRLKWYSIHAKNKYKMNVSHFNCLISQHLIGQHLIGQHLWHHNYHVKFWQNQFSSLLNYNSINSTHCLKPVYHTQSQVSVYTHMVKLGLWPRFSRKL